jgi:hypothetical protein
MEGGVPSTKMPGSCRDLITAEGSGVCVAVSVSIVFGGMAKPILDRGWL